MSPWKATPPKDDSGYFEQLTTHVFSAGLNWRVVQNKKKGFENAFAKFSPTKVSQFGEGEVKKLMNDAGIVRNERKIRATIENAGQFLALKKEYGSFKEYMNHFGKDEKMLLSDISDRFHHVGPSTARMFLWSVGYKLKPNREEKKWMSSHEV